MVSVLSIFIKSNVIVLNVPLTMGTNVTSILWQVIIILIINIEITYMHTSKIRAFEINGAAREVGHFGKVNKCCYIEQKGITDKMFFFKPQPGLR